MILIIPALARLIEAYRDAEIFEFPLEGRSFIWHLLKFPQYGLWIYFGGTVGLDLWIVPLSFVIAFGVFEISLKWFRKASMRNALRQTILERIEKGED